MPKIRSCKLEVINGQLQTAIEFTDGFSAQKLEGIETIRDCISGVIGYHWAQIKIYRDILRQAEGLDRSRLAIMDQTAKQPKWELSPEPILEAQETDIQNAQ